MKKILFLLLILFSFQANGQKGNPNVLFIPVDDLNHWIGYFGRNNQVITPNLDRLSAMGVSFTNAYCTAPACCPSRASVMSGIRPSSSGVYKNQNDWRTVIPDNKTIPSYFKANGYEVLGGGKIYHGGFDRDEEFDSYFREPKEGKGTGLKSKGQFGGIKWGIMKGEDEELHDYHVASWAMSELDKKHEKPFLLAAGIFRPHMPWNVPQAYFDLYPLTNIKLPPYKQNDLDDLPEEGKKIALALKDHENLKDEQQWIEAIQAYLACISFADAQIGRILDAYENSPEKDNTIIVLWGDHGWHLGEKDHWRKFSLWEEATRSPMIWVVPGLTKPGSVSNATVDFSSIFPTLAQVCNLNIPAHCEGPSIYKLLANPETKWKKPAITTFGQNNHAVRNSKFRFIQYESGGIELYDETLDPYEWTNIANSSTRIKRIQKKLAKHIPRVNVADIGNAKEASE